jgi:predicted transcriptional regulator
MLVIAQHIKAAQAFLGWGQYDLAVKSGIAISTIRRIEASNGSLCAHFETIAKIRRALDEGRRNRAMHVRTSILGRS